MILSTRTLLLTALSLCALTAAAGCSGASSDAEEDFSEGAVNGSTSAYTSIQPADCKTLTTDQEGGGGTANCGGLGGFELIAVEGDARSNVQVKSGNREFDLDVWSRPGFGGFSHLGPKAEWRGTKDASGLKPYALIFRYFVTQGGTGEETNSLVVARISKDAACIVGTVSGAIANHNVKAREMADANRDFQCPGTGGAIANAESLYTELQIGNCKVTKQGPEDEGSWVETDCGGHDGYRLLVSEGDLRQVVTVATGKQTQEQGSALDYFVTGSFNTVGPKAEWRVTGAEKKAHALIFRLTESEYVAGSNEDREHQYMIVSKLGRDRSCVTDIIDVQKHPGDHNALARVAADEAPAKACPAARPEPR